MDVKDFPTCSELEQQTRKVLEDALESLKRPYTWKQVDKALNGIVLEWWSHPTFEDEFYDSSEVGDFMIRAVGRNGSIAGYRTYPRGASEDHLKPRTRR